jgi:hypothetical protein
MKKLLMCAIFGVSLSAWASHSQFRCQALLTTEGLLNSESPYKIEISQIVRAAVPANFDELKIKITWGLSGVDEIVRRYMITIDDLATHQILPHIPGPADWPGLESFPFTIVVQGISKNQRWSIQNYKIHRWPAGKKIKFSLDADATKGSELDLLSLYTALSMAPFVDAVVFEQQILPTQLSYPEGPVQLSVPKELRAIRKLQKTGNDQNQFEEAVADVKPSLVKTLERNHHFDYQGMIVTGLSDKQDVVANSKAASFGIDYIFKRAH